MTSRFVFATVALAFAVAASAQSPSCPETRARLVPHRQEVGPAIGCSGLKVGVPGVQLTSSDECPSTVTLIPEHEVEEKSESATQTRLLSMVDGRLVTFTCETSYFLFFALGSTCVQVDNVAFGAYPRLQTIRCQI